MSPDPTPSKELVRDWLRQRRLAACPPPSIAQIRQAIGWLAPAKAPSAMAERVKQRHG